MIEKQLHNGKIRVENYGLFEWLLELQQMINQGYELDDSNEGFPQTFGQVYTCLLKPKVAVLTSGEFKNKPQEVLLDEQAETSLVLPVDELKDVLVIAPWLQTETPVVAKEAVIVAKQETEVKQEVIPDAEPVVKRGPKPKNK